MVRITMRLQNGKADGTPEVKRNSPIHRATGKYVRVSNGIELRLEYPINALFSLVCIVVKNYHIRGYKDWAGN
jgi:hypothetical protein